MAGSSRRWRRSARDLGIRRTLPIDALAGATVWTGAAEHPLLRRILGGALWATAGRAFTQLLVIASDVSGVARWTSFGSIDAATTTDAGMALAIRIALALSMLIVVFLTRIVHRDIYWTAVSLPGTLRPSSRHGWKRCSHPRFHARAGSSSQRCGAPSPSPPH